MPKSILSMYWSNDRETVNFGDFLNVPVISAFELDFVDIRSSTAEQIAMYPACVNAIGSTICENWRKLAGGKKIVVWGSGTYEGHGLTLESLQSQYDFRCVRGPVTRRVFGLPSNLPMGDPALLLKKVLSIDSSSRKGILSIPHFDNHSALSFEQRLEQEGADSMLSVWIHEADWIPMIERIARSKFVLTSSLHGAMMAQAYETPWALCLQQSDRLNKPLKWDDWAEYLGVQLRVVRNYREGMEWWESEGCKGTLQSLDQIEDSFPWDCVISTD